MGKNSFSNKAADFLQKTADLVREDFGWFMLFWLLSCSTQVIKWGMAGKTDLVMSMAFTGLLMALLATFITKWLFVPKASKIIRYILVALLFAAFIIEAFVLYQYGALTGVGTINSLFETNPEESAEFLNTFVGVQGGLLAVVIIAVMYCLVKYKPWHKLEADAISKKVIAGIVVVVSSSYAVYMCFAYPGIMFGGDNLTPLTRLMGATSTAWKNHVAYQELQAKLDVDIHLTKNDGHITNIV
ncbi:MAG: DUF1705 domain-containing protein, partial [Anaerovibrio sp.]|nr:DUF1705 domain-containing protein [Anaerovibrio sp.]